MRRGFVLAFFACFGSGFHGSFLGGRVEGGDGQLVDGLMGGFAELIQAVAGFHRDAHVKLAVGKAFALGQLKAIERLGTSPPGVKLGNVLCQHSDGGINLPLQGGFMAQHFVELIQTLVFRERSVLKELGLPAVQAAQTPGSRRDFLCLRHYFVSNVVALQEVAGAKLGDQLILHLLVAAGVFAQCRENDVAGKDAVGGGIAAGDGLAVFGGGHDDTVPVSALPS